ncbi:MAG TPA: HAD-IB family hydrolase [Bacillota bacterium]|nr:HAD-IB family hydrolase [Bacillota bacterium]
MRIAIFDFDGTLYKKETFQLLMDHLKDHPTYSKYYKRFFLPILPRFTGFKLNIYPESKMKKQSMQLYISALSKLTKDELEAYFEEIAAKMVDDFHPEAIRRLINHYEEDYRTIIVSGAYTPLLEAAMEPFPVDKIIGTDIPFAKNNYQKKAPIFHIQGMRKRVALLAALKEESIDWENSYSYGDSYSDLPILELVGHPVAVSPDDKLAAVASERKWEII